jgi:hypothetical protein
VQSKKDPEMSFASKRLILPLMIVIGTALMPVSTFSQTAFISTITGYDGDAMSVEILRTRIDNTDNSDINPIRTYACHLFLRFRSDCFKNKAQDGSRASFFLRPAPVIAALPIYADGKDRYGVPAKKLPRLDIEKLVLPDNLQRFLSLPHAEEPLRGSFDWSMRKEAVVEEGHKISQILETLSTKQPTCRFELEYDGGVERPCFGIFRYERQNVWGYAYCQVFRAGEIWTTPEYCIALSLTRMGTTYLAAWDSPDLTEEARGVGSEGFSCKVDIPAKFRGHFDEAVSEAVRSSKIDIDLRVKEKSGPVTLLAGRKTFAESKILPGEFEYTTGVVTVLDTPEGGFVYPNFSLTVSATKATSRIDYPPPNDEQLQKYQEAVPKEIEVNLAHIIGKKVRCDTPFD